MIYHETKAYAVKKQVYNRSYLNLFFIILSPFLDWLKLPGLPFITRRPLPYLEVWGNIPYDGTLIVPICIRNLWFQGTDAVIKLFWHVCRIQENGRNSRITTKNWTEQAQKHKDISLSIGAVYIFSFVFFNLINIPIDNFLFPLLFWFLLKQRHIQFSVLKTNFIEKSAVRDIALFNQYFSALPCMRPMHLFAILAK